VIDAIPDRSNPRTILMRILTPSYKYSRRNTHIVCFMLLRITKTEINEMNLSDERSAQSNCVIREYMA
jgi:hypothetical protein